MPQYRFLFCYHHVDRNSLPDVPQGISLQPTRMEQTGVINIQKVPQIKMIRSKMPVTKKESARALARQQYCCCVRPQFATVFPWNHPNGIYITQHLYKSKCKICTFEFKALFRRFKALRAKVKQSYCRNSHLRFCCSVHAFISSICCSGVVAALMAEIYCSSLMRSGVDACSGRSNSSDAIVLIVS